MRLYNYVPKKAKESVLAHGLYSSTYKDALKRYSVAANSKKKKDIITWLESVFPGRSRAVSCLTEHMKWRGNDPVLKKIVKSSALFSFELDDLIKAGLVESIWCRDDLARKGHRQHLTKDINHYFYKVKPEQIDISSLTWEKVNLDKQLMFGAVRHYMIVMKNGVIPPEYLRLEKNNLGAFYNLSQFIKRLFTYKK